MEPTSESLLVVEMKDLGPQPDLLMPEMHVCLLLSCFSLFVTPGTVARQAPLSMGCPRQEYWSGLPFHPPGDLPNPGITPVSPSLQADSLPAEPSGKHRDA